MSAWALAPETRDLPAAAGLGEVRAALARSGTALLQAPPGSGKTTLLPPALAGHLADLRRGEERVVVTQPRRVAARAAARRIAAVTGTTLGQEVGFAVRGERVGGRHTRIEVVTTGVLLRRLQRDPALEGVGAVMLDEVHERTLEADLVSAMLREVREALRPDLAVVAASATPATAALQRVWGTGADLPVIVVPGSPHPLQVRWHPGPAVRHDERGMTRAALDHVVGVTCRAAAEAEGDVLVFLPGVAEVDRAARSLLDRLPGIRVERLHGRLDPREQDRVLARADVRRIVVATPVAESSLTVPGVRVVVDSGLVRVPRLDRRRDLARLETIAASRASAEQRAGRAAREAPGVVYRTWSPEQHGTLPEHPAPEIATADLATFALQARAWSRGGARDLVLPDDPPEHALQHAERVLVDLGALAADGTDGTDGTAQDALRITPRGHSMLRLPLEVRLARAALDAVGRLGSRVTAEIVAALAEEVRSPGADLVRRLGELRREAPVSWRRSREDLERALDRLGGDRREPGLAVMGSQDDAAVGLVVALAHPERIARSRGEGRYLLASGAGCHVDARSPLREEEWLAVADADDSRGADALVRSAVPIDGAIAQEAGAALRHTFSQVVVQEGRIVAREVEALGAIRVRERPISRPDPQQVQEVLRDYLRAEGLDRLPWPPAARELRQRMAFLHAAIGEPWPAVDDEALLAALTTSVAPVRRVAEVDTLAGLRALLPWPEAARLEELAPTHLDLPSGRRARLTYDGDRPILAVAVQHAFGLRTTPLLAGGRVPVVVHLLSPAGRPAAITSDLAGFWESGYRAVRADLRGRYPKHAWPERP
ncbi:ATP-dependent helicase HrpB [Serinibacter salmoneus]|uniref:ATP-dependent helicase HrpB n=1 Tax=Serinibacter salmoneus TaxID=556530 RepID=A0A2A9CYV1_9MICO|nr:ATP-dependent helicase HrpB [Serinibacter salmoneus]